MSLQEREPIPEAANDAAAAVVDAAFAVHSALGPGLLESVYEVCLGHELKKRDRSVQRQVSLPVVYDGVRLDAGLRLDMVVDSCLIVETRPWSSSCRCIKPRC
jgi:GxxExxY protein